MTTTPATRATRRSIAAVATALLIIIGAPFATAGDCYSASVLETIGLPDGSTHPAGSITVCRVRALSPVAVLHSLEIGGRSQGLFIGKRLTVESAGAELPAFIFARGDSEALELRAVAYGSGSGYAAYRTNRIGRGTKPRVRTRGSFDLAEIGD